MKYRNVMIGGVSIAAACAAIGAGALVSSNAMAASANLDSATVHMVSIGPDGQPVSCTFDGVQLPSPITLTAISPEGGSTAISRINGSAPINQVSGSTDGTSIVVTASGPAPAGSEPAGATGQGTLTVVGGAAGAVDLTAGGAPSGVLPVLSADSARPGTAAECAVLKAQFAPNP